MAVIIASPWLPQAAVGTAYQFQLTATGGVPPYTWGAVSGLPGSMSLTSAGMLVGTPQNYGLYSINVTATDNVGATATANFQMTVQPAPLTFVTTLADQFSNSYVDVPYCDAYWSMHFNTVRAAQWAALRPEQKISALLQACRIIERVRFTSLKQLRAPLPLRYDRHSRLVLTLEDMPVPTKWLWTQRLQFPRNLDHDFVTGAIYIPEPIMFAQCEQAAYSLTFDDTVLANRMQGITESLQYVGNVHIRENYTQDGSEFAPRALEMCGPYMLKSTYEVRRQ